MPRVPGTGGLSDFLRSPAGASLESALARALSETLRQLKRSKLDPACLSMGLMKHWLASSPSPKVIRWQCWKFRQRPVCDILDERLVGTCVTLPLLFQAESVGVATSCSDNASKVQYRKFPMPSPECCRRGEKKLIADKRTMVLFGHYSKPWTLQRALELTKGLPHGARLAWQEGAVLVVIGSGASEKAGVPEARFALGYLTSNWEKLGKFKRAFGEINLEEMRAAVEPALVAEVQSKNTRQELVEAGRLFRKERCDRVILVSSPTHLPRCLRDACSLWLEPHSSSLSDNEGEDKNGWRKRWRPVVLASPSDTSFVDFGPDDVAIVEPPHRPGGAFLQTVALSSARMLDKSSQGAVKIAEDVEETAPLLHKLVASALKVGEEDRRQFHREFHALLRRYVPEE